MRNVMMVVPVFTTSCQVSLQWKIGPLNAQPRITTSASTNVDGWPEMRAVRFVRRVNQDVDFAGVMARTSKGQTSREVRRAGVAAGQRTRRPRVSARCLFRG